MSTDYCLAHKSRDIFSKPRRLENEEQVQSGLALTPSEMMEMANKGVPITPQNFDGLQYDEGYSKLDFDVPIEYRRGIDIGDCWEAEMDAKARLKSAKDKGLLQQVQEGGQ